MASLITESIARKVLTELKYENLELLGKGSFSIAFKATKNGDSKPLAVKALANTDKVHIEHEKRSANLFEDLGAKSAKIDTDILKNLEASGVINDDSVSEIDDGYLLGATIVGTFECKATKEESEYLKHSAWDDQKQEVNDFFDEQKNPDRIVPVTVFESVLMSRDMLKELKDLQSYNTRLHSSGLIMYDSFADLKNIAKVLITGLKKIHDQNGAHLDIKGDNLLLKQQCGKRSYKISDFGTSVKLTKEEKNNNKIPIPANGRWLSQLIPGFPKEPGGKGWKDTTNGVGLEDLQWADIFCAGRTLLEIFCADRKETSAGIAYPQIKDNKKTFKKKEVKKAKYLLKTDRMYDENLEEIKKSFYSLIQELTAQEPEERKLNASHPFLSVDCKPDAEAEKAMIEEQIIDLFKQYT